MENKGIITLENGLKIVYVIDKTKNYKDASITIKYGGINSQFSYNNKKYHTASGIAHFIEHLLIETSIYGNAYTEFKKNMLSLDGRTSLDRTTFSFGTVHDFEENLVKLIKIVNIANFTKEDIAKTKPAIIHEIKMTLDDKFRCLYSCTQASLFQKIPYRSGIGEEKEIAGLEYDDVMLCYKTFYRPSNEIIAISGNIDIEKIKKLIEKTYNECQFSNEEFALIPFDEPNEVAQNNNNISWETKEGYVQVNYKINIQDLSSYERVKLSFYLNMFLKDNFGPTGAVARKIIKEKISVYDISTYCYDIDHFIIVELGTQTNNPDKFIEVIKKAIGNPVFDEESFLLRKNKEIINLLLREEDPLSVLMPFVDNIVSYNYNAPDCCSDIERFTFEDYKSYIQKLNFDNYSVTEIIPTIKED